MKSNREVSDFVEAMCNRLCLNHAEYQAFRADPHKFLDNYADDWDIDKIVDLVGKRLDPSTLDSFWADRTACACSEQAYHIHSGNGGCEI